MHTIKPGFNSSDIIATINQMCNEARRLKTHERIASGGEPVVREGTSTSNIAITPLSAKTN